MTQAQIRSKQRQLKQLEQLLVTKKTELEIARKMLKTAAVSSGRDVVKQAEEAFRAREVVCRARNVKIINV